MNKIYHDWLFAKSWREAIPHAKELFGLIKKANGDRRELPEIWDEVHFMSWCQSFGVE